MPAFTTAFKNLKYLMRTYEVSQVDIAKKLNKSKTYISNRLTGQFSFTLDEAYEICDYLEIPYGKIPEYFPKGGVSPKGLPVTAP